MVMLLVVGLFSVIGKQAYAAEQGCSYPNATNVSAPYWVCDESLPKINTVGIGDSWFKAFANAMMNLAEINSQTIETMTQEYKLAGQVVTENIGKTLVKLEIGNIKIEGMIKLFDTKTDGKIDSINSVTSRISLDQNDCAFQIKYHVEAINDKNDEYLSISQNNCNINKFLHILEAEGVKIYDQKMGPKNTFYILLGDTNTARYKEIKQQMFIENKK